MKSKILVAALTAGWLLAVPVWTPRPILVAAQELFASPRQNPASETSTEKLGVKEKHWSGTLVDFGCIATVLRTGKEDANTGAGPTPPVSNFLAASPQAGHAGGGVSGNPDAGTTPGEGATSQDEQRLAQVARVDHAAKQCGPTSATQTFGLATSEGQVLRFDPQGDVKAGEALKETPAENGKRIRARVEGTLDNRSRLVVASIDIKGKGKHSSAE